MISNTHKIDVYQNIYMLYITQWLIILKGVIILSHSIFPKKKIEDAW